jgi:transposase InsO family protein
VHPPRPGPGAGPQPRSRSDPNGLEAGDERGPLPDLYHSDQGVQYAATAYTDLLAGREVAISMTAVGKPEENEYAERLMRTIREE